MYVCLDCREPLKVDDKLNCTTCGKQAKPLDIIKAKLAESPTTNKVTFFEFTDMFVVEYKAMKTMFPNISKTEVKKLAMNRLTHLEISDQPDENKTAAYITSRYGEYIK